MVDILETAADDTIEIPRNVMGLLRQSYDTRQKMLDWMLAIGVALLMGWAFRAELMGLLAPSYDVNDGTQDNYQPNMNLGEALRTDGVPSQIYTYNLPPSRNVRTDPTPQGVGLPSNPSQPPMYP
jgi:hypothetical protein